MPSDSFDKAEAANGHTEVDGAVGASPPTPTTAMQMKAAANATHRYMADRSLSLSLGSESEITRGVLEGMLVRWFFFSFLSFEASWKEGGKASCYAGFRKTALCQRATVILKKFFGSGPR